MEGETLIDREDQIRLISESVYRINSQLPDEIKMAILATPPFPFVISDEAKNLGICKDADEFKEDAKTFVTEIRVIFTTIEHKGLARGREFCTKPSNEDDTYRSALDRMVYHGILIMSTETPDDTVDLYEFNRPTSCAEERVVKLTMAGTSILCVGIVVLTIIVYFSLA